MDHMLIEDVQYLLIKKGKREKESLDGGERKCSEERKELVKSEEKNM